MPSTLTLDRPKTDHKPTPIRVPRDPPLRVPFDPPFQDEPAPATQTERAPIPPALKLDVIVNPFYENRILTIRLFGLTSDETTKRKTYQQIGHISVEAGKLDAAEIKKIAQVVADYSDRIPSRDSLRPHRLLQISSMKESGSMASRLKIYDEPEWDCTWEFSKSEPITPKSVSSALMDFLLKPKPPALPIS